MGWVSELIFNAGSGGLFGLLGSVVTSWQRLREKREDNRFAAQMADKSAASAEKVAEWSAFAASHSSAASDMTEKVSPWAANTRAVTRPYLTAFLVLAAFVSVFFVPAEDRRELVASLQVLAGTAVSWWFGSRMTVQLRSPSASPFRSPSPRS